MATPALTPPPTQDGSGPPAATPTSPPAASPAPPQPSPMMQQGTQDIIEGGNKLRGIAKQYPAAAPYVQQANDLMRQIMRAMMEHAEPGEPSGQPISG